MVQYSTVQYAYIKTEYSQLIQQRAMVSELCYTYGPVISDGLGLVIIFGASRYINVSQ